MYCFWRGEKLYMHLCFMYVGLPNILTALVTTLLAHSVTRRAQPFLWNQARVIAKRPGPLSQEQALLPSLCLRKWCQHRYCWVLPFWLLFALDLNVIIRRERISSHNQVKFSIIKSCKNQSINTKMGNPSSEKSTRKPIVLQINSALVCIKCTKWNMLISGVVPWVIFKSN